MGGRWLERAGAGGAAGHCDRPPRQGLPHAAVGDPAVEPGHPGVQGRAGAAGGRHSTLPCPPPALPFHPVCFARRAVAQKIGFARAWLQDVLSNPQLHTQAFTMLPDINGHKSKVPPIFKGKDGDVKRPTICYESCFVSDLWKIGSSQNGLSSPQRKPRKSRRQKEKEAKAAKVRRPAICSGSFNSLWFPQFLRTYSDRGCFQAAKEARDKANERAYMTPGGVADIPSLTTKGRRAPSFVKQSPRGDEPVSPGSSQRLRWFGKRGKRGFLSGVVAVFVSR